MPDIIRLYLFQPACLVIKQRLFLKFTNGKSIEFIDDLQISHATHMLIIIALKGKESKVTSDFLASSVGVNPVIIRKTLSQLKKAELISVARGTGGAEIIKDLEDISLLDVYQAVECLGKTGQLFSFHDNPNPACPVGANIHGVLDEKLQKIQLAMEQELSQTSLAQVVADAEARIEK